MSNGLETVMAGKLRRFHGMLGAASLLGFLVGSSIVTAQSDRIWVDPPSDSGASPQATQPEKAAAPPSAPTQPTRSSPGSETASPAGKTGPRIGNADNKPPDVATQQATDQTAAPKAEPTKRLGSPGEGIAAAKAQRRAASAARRKEQAAERARASRAAQAAARRAPNKRFDTVQDAVDSGLEVMSLRTIELPDGRRIRVLVRPDPRVMSEVLARRYP